MEIEGEHSTQETDVIPGQGQRIEDWADVGQDSQMQKEDEMCHAVCNQCMSDDNARLAGIINDVFDARMDAMRSEIAEDLNGLINSWTERLEHVEGVILSLQTDRCTEEAIKEIRNDIATMHRNMLFLRNKMTPQQKALPHQTPSKEEADKEHLARKEKAKRCLDFGYEDSRKRSTGSTLYKIADQLTTPDKQQADEKLNSRAILPADVPSTSKQGGRIIPNRPWGGRTRQLCPRICFPAALSNIEETPS